MDGLLRLLKVRTGSNVIGFFVGETKDVVHRACYFYPEFNEFKTYEERNAFVDKIKTEFKAKSSLIVQSKGFDEYYILRANGLEMDDDEELTFKENATTRGMASAFAKHAGKKVSNRVILNRFIDLIA